MNHNWTKLGQIFHVDNNNPYMVSHASNPLAIHLCDNIFRIFYSGRNKDNRSSVGYVDIDIVKLKVINYPKNPILTYGEKNSFYSHGISIGNAFEIENKTFILFMGWQCFEDAHWRGDIGQIRLRNNRNMEVTSKKVPFLGIDKEDPISLSYPFVLYDNGVYHMWYGSTETWDAGNNEMIHVLKYATSKKGKTWKRHGLAVPYEIGMAQAFSRPCVLKIKKEYHMWYSYRSGKGEKYRIGYACSNDGKSWARKDNYKGIAISKSGWDSEMICYPFVFKHKSIYYMLYNGNNYGEKGFGLAKWNLSHNS